jgi:hypothetical protein
MKRHPLPKFRQTYNFFSAGYRSAEQLQFDVLSSGKNGIIFFQPVFVQNIRIFYLQDDIYILRKMWFVYQWF